MEKIQAAIAKARAQRDDLARERGAAPAETAPAAPPPPEGVEAAWRLLPTFSPDAAKMVERRVMTLSAGQPATIFDVLRTKVLQQMRAQNWRRLAITSPGAHCGKSTIALNLAFSLARQADLRVIVAEMDLRRPSLAKTLEIKAPLDFARVLEGAAPFAEHAIRPRPNLAVATNLRAVKNPSELLQSPAVGPALAAIETTYQPDVTIFDMPPMLVSDDTMAFMGHVDCALLVAAAGATTTREVDICESDLAQQTNVMGVVLNKCRYMEKDYGYGYEYEY